jgi:hypothetical protein
VIDVVIDSVLSGEFTAFWSSHNFSGSKETFSYKLEKIPSDHCKRIQKMDFRQQRTFVKMVYGYNLIGVNSYAEKDQI